MKRNLVTYFVRESSDNNNSNDYENKDNRRKRNGETRGLF